MSAMPDWLKIEQKVLSESDEVRFNTTVDSEFTARINFQLGFDKCFEILSKPENQAKMPETKALIEAAKQNIEWEGQEFLLVEALKPFEGE